MKAGGDSIKIEHLTPYLGGQYHVNIDGDPLVYSVAFSGQKNTFTLATLDGEVVHKSSTRARLLGNKYKQWTDDQLKEEGLFVVEESELEDIEEVRQKLLGKLQSIIKNCKASTWTIYISGEGNWRNSVASMRKYKAGRSEKPLLYKEVRNIMEEELGAIAVYGIEADDALAIASWKALKDIKKQAKGPAEENTRTILCSVDKDLRQVPGLYYNPTWGTEVKPQIIDKIGSVYIDSKNKLQFTGLKGFYAQILLGDSTDAIPGVKGCGPKYIFNLLNGLDNEEDMFNAVLGAIKSKLGETIEYYEWQDWEDPHAPPTRKTIREGADVVTISAEEYMTEVGNLLYMLRKPLKEGKLPWKAPRKYLCT